MLVNLFRNLKDSIGKLFKSRLVILILFFGILSFILVQRIFTLQIVNGQDYLENYKLLIKRTIETQGTRGTIYDRNGEILATNRLAYSVQIEDNGSYSNKIEKNQLINETIKSVIDIVEKNGDTIVNDFGIVLDDNGNYSFLYAEGTRRLRFLADIYGYPKIDNLKQDERNATPEDVLAFLCANKRSNGYGFGIDREKYDKETVLKLVTIRYGMHLNSFKQYIPTTIALDVCEETVAYIKENMVNLQGISIGEESIREYPDSKYFASIIGYTGKISQEEYDALSKKDKERYSLTDIIGKAGIEQTMDSVLQGEKGKKTFYVNSVGKVIESEENVEPKAGNNLYLSIDKDLQITAYKLLEQKLAGIILDKMANILDYTRNPEIKSSEIIIPIGDIYYSFIGNEILDTNQFAQENASATEKAVYRAYNARQASAIDQIIANLESSSGTIYKKLPKEMQAYMYYISSELLTSKTGILSKSRIDTSDEVYKAWKNEKINLYQYLNHAISMNWIDASVLQKYSSTNEKYSNSSELYHAILDFLSDYLKTDSSFEKLVYRYMIKDGTITGNQVCLMLYEQGILSKEDTWYRMLSTGYNPYNFIREKIEKLEITPGQLGVEPSTGSIVMTDPSSGKTLVCVSYPGYDNNRLANGMDSDYYNQLNINLASPLYNRATQETTAPGSTFKPVSAAAALTEGMITANSYASCSGPYTNITPSPKCWIYPRGHGSLNVIGAIAHSCNNFFFDVGYHLGITSNGKYSSELGTDTLAKYAKMFGLGDESGLEIPESSPNISDEDAVRSAIGQGTNTYTTSQLARYISVIANQGTVYDLTLLNKTEDSNGNIIQKYEPNISKKITEISSSTFDLIRQGMAEVVKKDSRFNSVRSAGMQMSGKTGTAQQSKTHSDHALFVGYAPSTNPEIAFVIRIANGYSSGNTADIGRDLVRKYFNLADNSELLTGYASSINVEVYGD